MKILERKLIHTNASFMSWVLEDFKRENLFLQKKKKGEFFFLIKKKGEFWKAKYIFDILKICIKNMINDHIILPSYLFSKNIL